MFISLGFDLSQLRDQKGLVLFHKIFRIVQQVLYQNHGSLNKLLMDDKGTTLIAMFGSQPHIHQNDSSRAVSASLQLTHQLRRVKIDVNIGITTSRVFTGVIGTSGGRREYSLLGDGVNLAARLMQHAGSTRGHNVFIDETTFIESSNRMDCVFHKKIEVKGKENKIKVYYPVEKYKICFAGKYRERKRDRFKNFMKNFVSSLSTLHISEVPPYEPDVEKFEANGIENDPNYRPGSHRMVGRSLESRSFLRHMESIYGQDSKKSNLCLIIRGESGCGKNFFLKKSLLEYKNSKFFEKPWLFFNSISTSDYKNPYNSLRHFYAKIISAARQTIEPDVFKSEEEFVRSTCQEYYKDNEYALKVFEQELDNFINRISIFRQNVIYITKDHQSLSHRLSECGKLAFLALFKFFQKLFRRISKGKFLIALDQADLMDKESTHVIKYLLGSVQDTIIIFILKTSFIEEKGSFDSPEEFCKFYLEEDINGGVIELKRLRKKESDELVDICFKVKYAGYLMTVTREIKDYVYERCKGNCKDTFYLIDSLIENKHLSPNFDGRSLMTDSRIPENLEFRLSEEMKVSLEIDTFNKFIVSPISFENKYRSVLIKISPELSLTINMAAVIGDIFDDKIIKKINVFSHFSKRAIDGYLKKLITLDYIEVIGIKQDRKIFRFTHPFLRRLVYERMLFEHRRSLHKVYLEFLRVNPMPSYLWGGKMHLKDSVIEEHLEYHFVNSIYGEISEKEHDVRQPLVNFLEDQ